VSKRATVSPPSRTTFAVWVSPSMNLPTAWKLPEVPPVKGAEINSLGDHRIAMAFAIAGLFAEGETVIKGVECIETSYPGFIGEFERLQSMSS